MITRGYHALSPAAQDRPRYGWFGSKRVVEEIVSMEDRRPFAGAWIETRPGRVEGWHIASPFAGAWIETPATK
jgi:hypothetical protein